MEAAEVAEEVLAEQASVEAAITDGMVKLETLGTLEAATSLEGIDDSDVAVAAGMLTAVGMELGVAEVAKPEEVSVESIKDSLGKTTDVVKKAVTAAIAKLIELVKKAYVAIKKFFAAIDKTAKKIADEAKSVKGNPSEEPIEVSSKDAIIALGVAGNNAVAVEVKDKKIIFKAEGEVSFKDLVSAQSAIIVKGASAVEDSLGDLTDLAANGFTADGFEDKIEGIKGAFNGALDSVLKLIKLEEGQVAKAVMGGISVQTLDAESGKVKETTQYKFEVEGSVKVPHMDASDIKTSASQVASDFKAITGRLESISKNLSDLNAKVTKAVKEDKEGELANRVEIKLVNFIVSSLLSSTVATVESKAISGAKLELKLLAQMLKGFKEESQEETKEDK